jgi:parallel beta-helix repeat protein
MEEEVMNVKRILIAGLFIAAFFAVPSTVFSDTYYVPDDYGTIQMALDAAVAGDEIIVRDGVWTGDGNVNLAFGAKALTLRSENGADKCIINCGRIADRGFFFNGGETSASVVDGFTILNGTAYGNYPLGGGGAILCYASSPTITNCTISNNYADSYGGGIFCVNSSSPTITKCRIRGNFSNSKGGGIAADNLSSVTISNCTVSGNFSMLGGGGILYEGDSSLTIDNCTISGNSSIGPGGGISIESCDGAVTNCKINGNYSEDAGGGISVSNGSSATIADCTISGNTSSDEAGGIGCFAASLNMNNCAVADNFALSGGGIWFDGTPYSHSVSNATIVGNRAFLGGGIKAQMGAQPVITNSILWDNSAYNGHEIALGTGSPTLELIYCTVDTGRPMAIEQEIGSSLIWDAGIDNTDPLFVAGPSGDYYLSQTAAGQAGTSPCVNTGNNSAASLGMDSYTTRTDAVADSGTVDRGYHYALPPGLSQIDCVSPRNGSTLYSPPTFTWRPDGGTDNVFAVDLSYSYPISTYWSTYEDYGQLLEANLWQMPVSIWNQIPSGSFVYWRVRGADLDVSPLNIIYGDSGFWFYKP